MIIEKLSIWLARTISYCQNGGCKEIPWFTGKLIKHTSAKTLGAESRKCNMGQKQKIHAEANAENTI